MKIIIFADTDDKRRNGLMHHRPLGIDECALFFFPRQADHSFWNKNVSFPISLLFLDSNGAVKDIKYLEAEQTSAVRPDSRSITYVVEAHYKFPSLYGIKKGSIATIKGNEVTFDD